MFESTNMNSFDFDSTYTGDNGINYNDIDINMVQENETYDNMNNNMSMSNSMMSPITECPKEKVVNRTIVHDVPHICPIRTRIINHHVYRHIYKPEYSCCEENVVSNVQCGSCQQFM